MAQKPIRSTADVPGLTSALDAKKSRTAWTLTDTFKAPQRVDGTNILVIRGIDTVDGRMIASDLTSGTNIRQSVDGGASWSSPKGLPSNVTAANFLQVVRFKTHLYALVKDTVDSYYKVYRALPAAANVQFSWSLVHTITTAGLDNFFTTMDCNDTALLVGEYGDPVGGPSVYRTTDGTTWGVAVGPLATRHIHCISFDPYNAGHVYMTVGDNNTAASSWYRSTDHGATFATLNIAGRQSVQISHTAEYAIGAADANNGTAHAYRKSDGAWFWLAANDHKWMPYPGGTTANDKFLPNAYYGIVDPATGVYYFVADGTAGQRYGLFAVPAIGECSVFLGEPAATVNTGFARMYIYNGWVWWGQYKHQLLTRAAV